MAFFSRCTVAFSRCPIESSHFIADYNWQDQSCSDIALGLENRAIPDSSIESENSDTSPSDARLGEAEGWCAPGNLNGVYLKVDLWSPHVICAIGTQGNLRGNVAYVQSYQLELAIKDNNSEFYKENGTIKVCYCTVQKRSGFNPGEGERRFPVDVRCSF